MVAAVDALVVERVDQQGYSAQCASTNNFWLPKILDQHPRLVLFSTFFFLNLKFSTRYSSDVG